MSSNNTPPAVANASSGSEPILRRRKIRKGTFSCWECKHRKKRCELVPGSTSCVFCQRHGLACTSQESADTSNDHSRNAEQRVDQVEALVNKLVQQRNERPRQRKPKSLPYTSRNPKRLGYPTLNSVNHERMSRGPSLTSYLFSVLPNPNVATVILRNNKLFKSPLPINQKPHPAHPGPEGLNADPAPPPSAHPVLFAHKLIQLAICLQNSDAETSDQLQIQLREPVISAARRYFDTACGYVLSHDKLISSLDGLQTLMLQGRYYITIGDLRKAWSVHQRASSIASAMGIPLLAQTMGGRADSVWFQLVYSDRFLSLMLGLPHAITANYLERSDCQDTNTPAQVLERTHVLAAGKIIARNMRIQNRGSSYECAWSSNDELLETRDIDQILKRATRLLPSSWWLAPSLRKGTMESEVPERTGRLLAQMHQYYLLVLLHQPYLLQKLVSDSNDCRLPNSAGAAYSILAAASASREVISRYLEYRGYDRSPSCRALDDKCFLASITLLFVHLEGHQVSSMNVLEHQRCHDLGMIERVIEFIKLVSALNQNSLAAAQSQTLSKLLEIEAHAADGLPYLIRVERGMSTGDVRDVGATLHDFQVSVLYCGIVHISHQVPPVWNPDGANSTTFSSDFPDNDPVLTALRDDSLAIEGS